MVVDASGVSSVIRSLLLISLGIYRSELSTAEASAILASRPLSFFLFFTLILLFMGDPLGQSGLSQRDTPDYSSGPLSPILQV